MSDLGLESFILVVHTKNYATADDLEVDAMEDVNVKKVKISSVILM